MGKFNRSIPTSRFEKNKKCQEANFLRQKSKKLLVFKMASMWRWQKYLFLLLTLFFAGSGLYLIFVYLKTNNEGIWYQNLSVSRELVLASGVLSLILTIPSLCVFTAFQKIEEIKRNPRGILYEELADLLEDESQHGPMDDEYFSGN